MAAVGAPVRAKLPAAALCLGIPENSTGPTFLSYDRNI